jgi:hypothetical protein
MHVYVGPFFIVGKSSFLKRTEINRCSNTLQCGKVPQVSGAFCAYCGSPITKQESESTVHRAPTPEDLEGDWTDVMVVAEDTKGQTVWIPNKGDYGTYFSRYQPEPLLVIDAEGIRRRTADFLAGHRDLFDAYHKRFGSELIEAFGAVPY